MDCENWETVDCETGKTGTGNYDWETGTVKLDCETGDCETGTGTVKLGTGKTGL